MNKVKKRHKYRYNKPKHKTVKSRQCRLCKAELDRTRYFYCLSCLRPNSEDITEMGFKTLTSRKYQRKRVYKTKEELKKHREDWRDGLYAGYVYETRGGYSNDDADIINDYFNNKN